MECFHRPWRRTTIHQGSQFPWNMAMFLSRSTGGLGESRLARCWDTHSFPPVPRVRARCSPCLPPVSVVVAGGEGVGRKVSLVGACAMAGHVSLDEDIAARCSRRSCLFQALECLSCSPAAEPARQFLGATKTHSPRAESPSFVVDD